MKTKSKISHQKSRSSKLFDMLYNALVNHSCCFTDSNQHMVLLRQKSIFLHNPSQTRSLLNYAEVLHIDETKLRSSVLTPLSNPVQKIAISRQQHPIFWQIEFKNSNAIG